MSRAIPAWLQYAVRNCHIQQQRWHSVISKPRPIMQSPPRHFEEETCSVYNPEHWYPVHIGEVFESKYRVIGKLGYGCGGTSWLCKDLRTSEFVTIKVCMNDHLRSAHSSYNEYHSYKQMASFDSRHEGTRYIRRLVDRLILKGPHREHRCFVFPPMHTSIKTLWEDGHYTKNSRSMIDAVMNNLLHALVYLHEEAGIIHTRLHASNVMLTIKDSSVLEEFEQAELNDPLPAKVVDDTRTIYTTRKIKPPNEQQLGYPVLCDFACAHVGEQQSVPDQSDRYRCPEVLLDLPWTYSTDIWNLGAFLWNLVEDKSLFYIEDEISLDIRDDHVIEPIYDHFAEMIGYFGRPPQELIERGNFRRRYLDELGIWMFIYDFQAPQSRCLENAAKAFQSEEKKEFLDFLRLMMKWVPEERASARQLLGSSWMEGKSHV